MTATGKEYEDTLRICKEIWCVFSDLYRYLNYEAWCCAFSGSITHADAHRHEGLRSSLLQHRLQLLTWGWSPFLKLCEQEICQRRGSGDLRTNSRMWERAEAAAVSTFFQEAPWFTRLCQLAPAAPWVPGAQCPWGSSWKKGNVGILPRRNLSNGLNLLNGA